MIGLTMKIGDSVQKGSEAGIVLHIERRDEQSVIWFLSLEGITFCSKQELRYAER